MAAPSYATDLASIIIEMPNTTGWTLISSGGGGANTLTAPETDDFVQGANCISRNPWTTAAIRGMVYNAATTIAAGDVMVIWIKSDATQALDTVAAGGIQALIGSGSGDLNCYYVDGSDTAVKGGWIAYFIDPRTGSVTPSTTVGTPTATRSFFGARWSVAATGPSKGFPFKIDAIRHGRRTEITLGDSGAGGPATWDDLAAFADATAQRWGFVQVTATGALMFGNVFWGLSASADVYSRDSNRTVVFGLTPFATSSFTNLYIQSNGATDIEWTGMTFVALDSVNRGAVWVNDNAVFSLIDSAFEDTDTTLDGGTNSVWDGTVWRRCNAVTAAGGSFLGCGIRTPTVAANTSGFVYPVATDPDGVLDGMTFSKGANAHHAIEFGTSSPLSMTLRGLDFTGFSASTNVNDSVFHIKRTTGTVTINLVGCTSDVSLSASYRTDGATVVIVEDPVTTAVTVLDIDTLAAIQSARVYLEADTGGPLSVGTVIINALTNASGFVSDTRTLASDQPIVGWVRKATSGDPLYKQASVVGSIDSVTGLTLTVQMIPDE